MDKEIILNRLHPANMAWASLSVPALKSFSELENVTGGKSNTGTLDSRVQTNGFTVSGKPPPITSIPYGCNF